MEPSTILKAALESAWKAFLYRRFFSYIKNKAYSKISNSRADIWILGRPNVGKSSILKCLLDEIKTSSNPPPVSLKIETGVLLLGKSYAKTVRVAPGQTYVFERFKEEFTKSFSTQNPSTVVFVVDFGHNFSEVHGTPANGSPTPEFAESLKEHKEKQIKIESEHIDYIIKQIKNIPAALLSIKNIVIIINKIDLFERENIEQAIDYYDPLGNSDFSKKIKLLASHLNRNDIGYSIFTLCAWPRHQNFKGIEIRSTFDHAAHSASRSNFIKQFDNMLES
ncbi:MAG: GTPase [Acidovorax sp.]